MWEASMGKLTDGRTAYGLTVAEKTLSAAIYTPSALNYAAPGFTSEVDIVKTNDVLRQIKVPQGLADIVVVNASEYDIRYYRPADVLPKVNGIYGVTGQPFVTWKFKNPDTSSTTKLLIQKIENGTVVDQSEYSWEPIADAWTLSTGFTPDAGTYSRIDAATVSRPGTNLRTVINTVRDNSGQIASKTTKTYQTFPWGEELVQVIQDPEVSALTTTYEFYTDITAEGSYGQLKSIRRPDGSWEKYEYNDNDWSISRILRPWKDQTLESASPETSRTTLYQYARHDGFQLYGYYKFVTGIQEQIQGTVVSNKTFTRWSADNGVPLTVNGQPVVREERLEYASASVSQVTTITRYYKTATPFLANRIADVEYPDGRKDTYTYEKGDYVPNADPSLSQFTPNANGLAQRRSIVHGTTTSPDGVAFKTTRETFVTDQFANEVLKEIYVYNGSTYERVEWVVNTYDDRGHLTTTRDNKGQLVTAVWTGDKNTSHTDVSGIETVNEYDELGRLKKQTKKGITAGSGFPSQAEIVTTFTYDAEGRQKVVTVAAAGPSLSSAYVYDKAGRLKQETDQAQLNTTYSYASGGRIQTTIRSGGATEITTNYIDGQTKSLTGTGQVARNYDPGVNPDGTRYTNEYIGDAGLSSPRWTRTTTDWLGRTIAIEKPSFTSTAVLTITYNQLGQVQKQTLTSNSVKLLADRLFEYDELGRPIRSGIDVDNNGTLTLASADRLSEADAVFEKTGSDWFQVATGRTYLVDNNSTAVTLIQRDRLNNFSLNGTLQTVIDSTVIDLAGNQTRSTVAIDRPAKKVIATTDTPESNLDAVEIRMNGLLQSASATTPESVTTFTYDSLGRQIGVTDPRNGSTGRTFNSKGQLDTTNDGAGTTTYEYYPDTHLNAGRLKSITNAVTKKSYFAYNSRGDLVQTWGDTTYPLEYVYDSYGQQTELHTFRGGQNWTAALWPANVTGTADVTKWIYQDATGLVTQKLDAALKGATHTYDELGRLKTRTWARGVTCTYGYDGNTGELRTITYSDGTPAVSFTYDRGGRPVNVTDAAGSRTRTFNVAGELATEQIAGGILNNVGMTIGYDGFLRRNSMQTTQGANTLSSQTYGYDTSSRLETITSGSEAATYSYHANSGLLNTTTFSSGTSIARSYDGFGRLENITTTPAADLARSYVYTYNNLNQRTRVTREDGSYWSYSYDDRGELVSGKKYWSDNSPVLGAQTEYSFDNIGNRKYARNGGNQFGALRQSTYTANPLNQHTQRTVPGAVDVTGTANSAATVTVNGGNTVRRGDYFYKELAVDNNSGPVSQPINVVGARNNFGAGGEDAISEKGGRKFLPSANEAFTYDDDGNLTSDGHWLYTWDAENNLVSMQAAPGVPAEAKLKLEFSYDYARRRIQKNVYVWNVPTSTYTLQSVRKFVYDGSQLVAELDGTFATVRTFTWGQDVGGGLQTIAGIGGLLLISDGTNSYRVFYDGNGNVGGLVNGSTGTLSALYEYDPFGSVLKSVGDYARQNPIKFSTKYTDEETDLVYYGFRYYQPDTGKWIGQDPIAEQGGLNLSAFNSNDPVNKLDAQGLYEIDVHYYLTYFLTSKHRCFTPYEASDMANDDQGTDENPKTWPGPGWDPLPGDATQKVVPNGAIGMINSYLSDRGFPVANNNNYQQQYQNMYYHALHPGAAEGIGNPDLWNKALDKCWVSREFGQYLHYLQDTFAHSGYTSPKCGHGCQAQHLPDHTLTDPEKTLRAAKATWKALNDYAKRVKCDCQDNWNPEWDAQILRFARVGYPTELVRRLSEGGLPKLDFKRQLLELPMRSPGDLTSDPRKKR